MYILVLPVSIQYWTSGTWRFFAIDVSNADGMIQHIFQCRAARLKQDIKRRQDHGRALMEAKQVHTRTAVATSTTNTTSVLFLLCYYYYYYDEDCLVIVVNSGCLCSTDCSEAGGGKQPLQDVVRAGRYASLYTRCVCEHSIAQDRIAEYTIA